MRKWDINCDSGPHIWSEQILRRIKDLLENTESALETKWLVKGHRTIYSFRAKVPGSQYRACSFHLYRKAGGRGLLKPERKQD